MGRPRIGITDRDRFWANINKDGKQVPYVEHNCWNWLARKDGYGYGVIRFNSKSQKAHRVSYIIHNGEIPIGKLVCHKCDNPPCCNPEHLFLGTKKDNALDMESKNRGYHPTGDGHWSRFKPERVARSNNSGAFTKPEGIRKGMKNGRAKLTDIDILEIRNLRARGLSYKELAKLYLVGKTTISHIIKGHTWKHI